MANPSAAHKMLPNLGTSHKQEASMLAEKLMKQNTSEQQSGNLPVYHVLTKPTFVKEDKCQRLTLAEEGETINEKVLLMIGETGAGKTTLINAMFNYILGVEWEHHFRFKLVNENLTESQAQSQTSMITAYEIPFFQGSRIRFPLTIVDTPGFGHTEGLEADKHTMEQLKECFSSPECIGHLNAVCFVITASSARLTAGQKYIFDSVYSIFGKDIADNILFMFTFADEGPPRALAPIREAHLPGLKGIKLNNNYFTFNNSSVFRDNTHDRSSPNWSMVINSMGWFFDRLELLDPKSLVLTKEVLLERDQLEATLQVLPTQVRACLTTLEGLRQTEKALEENLSSMKENRNFTFNIVVMFNVPEPITSQSAMNCQKCETTCHHPCKVLGNPFNYFCEVIGVTGNCKICTDNCKVADHKLESYIWRKGSQLVQREYSDVKEKYEAAYGKAMEAAEIIEKIQNEYNVINEKILSLIEKCCKCLTRLQEIALKPDPMTAPEYIDKMIKREEKNCDRGYSDRVEFLRGLKQQAVKDKMKNKEKQPPEVETKYKNVKDRIAQVSAQAKLAIVSLLKKDDYVKSRLDYYGDS